MTGGPASWRIKLLLIVFAAIIAIGTLVYTKLLVEKLQKKDKQVVELYAKGIQYLASSDTPNNDFTFIFENIIKPIDFPIILTGPDNTINLESRSGYRNLTIDSTWSNYEKKEFLANKIKELDAINRPIKITFSDTIVLGLIHYGDSELIEQLRYYPYFQIFVAAMFILIGYVSFNYIRRSEQSNIWVGMAKETAHQLGTPISSLMGWSEILKMSYSDPDKVLDVADELDNDIVRLNKITQRFSKIGSAPELRETNLYDLIDVTVQYFRRRLPHSGKSVEISIDGDNNLTALLNAELFEWVFENLIKNALDAIESKKGFIKFSIFENKKFIEIEVEDSGKGIDLKRRKDIFRPGYSTKRRGWGLGLSLTKRIVEGYHNGKIFVKNSSPEGTTFKIILPK
jgi:signal transduction histidine kinase